MQIITLAELHTGILLGGKNHKEKLHANTQTGLKLFYNPEEKQMYAMFNNEIAIIPETNISYMIPYLDSSDELRKVFEQEIPLVKPRKTHISHASKLDIRSAQISDPTTQVQNPRK